MERPLNYDRRPNRHLDAGLLARDHRPLLPGRESGAPVVPRRRLRADDPGPVAVVPAPDPALVRPPRALHRLLRTRPSLQHPRHDQRGLRPHRAGERADAAADHGAPRPPELADPDRHAVRARLRGGARRRRDPDRDGLRAPRRRLLRGRARGRPRPAADHGRDALRRVLHRPLQRRRRQPLRVPRPADPPHLMAEQLLDVKGLKVRFTTEDGIVRAVDGVDFELDRGQVLGIVGESGSGKSVTALTMLGLTRAPNTTFEGEVTYKGQNLLALSERRLRDVRGNEIAMIFQDPMTSLNPVYKVGDQIS